MPQARGLVYPLRRPLTAPVFAATGPQQINPSRFGALELAKNQRLKLILPATAPGIFGHAASPIRPALAGAARQPRSRHVRRAVRAGFDTTDDPAHGRTA